MAVLTITCTKDCSLETTSSSNEVTTRGSDTTILVARPTGTPGSKDPQAYFAGLFPVTSIPAGATISAASLLLYIESTSGWTSGESCAINQLDSAFSETNGSARPTYGVQHYIHTLGVSAPAQGSYNILTLAQGWYAGTITNHGLLWYYSTGVDDNDLVYIRSREYGGGTVPRMQVTYTTVPGTPGVFTVPATGGDYNNSISADWGDATDLDGDSLTYELQYAPSPYSSWTTIGSLTAGSARVVDTTAWAVGSYKMRTRAYDGVQYGAYRESGVFTITHNVNPNTPTNVGRQTPYTDTTPVLTADITDNNNPQQIKARFQLYQSDGTTLIATIDSAFLTGNGTATAEYTSALPVGTYKVQAKTIDDLGAESAYSAQSTIYVTQELSEDLTLLWNVRKLSTEDLTILWNVIRSGEKDLTLLWDVYQDGSEDLTLLWRTKTPWRPVTTHDDSNTWSEA